MNEHMEKDKKVEEIIGLLDSIPRVERESYFTFKVMQRTFPARAGSFTGPRLAYSFALTVLTLALLNAFSFFYGYRAYGKNYYQRSYEIQQASTLYFSTSSNKN